MLVDPNDQAIGFLRPHLKRERPVLWRRPLLIVDLVGTPRPLLWLVGEPFLLPVAFEGFNERGWLYTSKNASG